MSVLIKGMKIPNNCNDCRFLEGDNMDGLCHAIGRWLDDEHFSWYRFDDGDIDDSKPFNCPLIDVPDEDASTEKEQESINKNYLFTYSYDIDKGKGGTGIGSVVIQQMEYEPINTETLKDACNMVRENLHFPEDTTIVPLSFHRFE